MSDGRNLYKQIGISFIALATAVFVLSFPACFLIKEGFLGRVPEIYGFIVYLAGPLPVIPFVLGVTGLLFIGVSALQQLLERSTPLKVPNIDQKEN